MRSTSQENNHCKGMVQSSFLCTVLLSSRCECLFKLGSVQVFLLLFLQVHCFVFQSACGTVLNEDNEGPTGEAVGHTTIFGMEYGGRLKDFID